MCMYLCTYILNVFIYIYIYSRWWVQKFVIFLALPGQMIQFDEYLSNGLKPPTRYIYSYVHL